MNTHCNLGELGDLGDLGEGGATRGEGAGLHYTPTATAEAGAGERTGPSPKTQVHHICLGQNLPWNNGNSTLHHTYPN